MVSAQEVLAAGHEVIDHSGQRILWLVFVVAARRYDDSAWTDVVLVW